MRQIFHTCLLAIRLIAGTTTNSVMALQTLNMFDAGLLNAAFGYVFVDPGADRRPAQKAFHLFPSITIGTVG